MSKEEFGHDEIASPRHAEPFVEDAELERRCAMYRTIYEDNISQTYRILWKVDLRLIPPLFIMVKTTASIY